MGYEGTEVQVQRGGTGVQSLTSKGVIIGQGINPVEVTDALTDGQLLIGSTGNNPVPSSLTSSNASINITQGAGTLDLTSTVSASGTFATNAVLKGVDGTGAIQDSGVLIDGSDACTGMTQLDVDNIRIDGNNIASTDTNGPINLVPNGSGNVSMTKASIGNDIGFLSYNTDNTNTASHSFFQATTGGTSGGDPYLEVGILGTRAYGFGIDNSAGTDLQIYTAGSTNSAPSGSTKLWQATSAGEVTMPLQPAFLAQLAATRTNVTGDGTNYTVVWGTEIFDQNSDWDNTSTFTAPVTGRYQFNFGVLHGGLSASFTNANQAITTSNRNFIMNQKNIGAVQSGGQASHTMSVLTDMDTADTATAIVNVSGSTKTVSVVLGGATDPRSYFSGNLFC